MNFTNKNVLVYGTGISGISAVSLLESVQAKVILYDENTKITKEQVVNAIREKFGKGIFTPNAVKNFEVDKIRGIYIPYYLFDVYYHDCEKMYVKEGVGDNAKTVNYIVEAECEFKQISCDASKKLSDESTQRL